MWGDNSQGQIGLGDEGFSAEPREVGVGEVVIWVSCGYHHSAFVTGTAQSNQTQQKTPPTQFECLFNQQYCVGFVVLADGDLFTFGESANGRLGLQGEQLANHRVPQRVQGIVGHVTQVSCGGEHTVALTGRRTDKRHFC